MILKTKMKKVCAAAMAASMVASPVTAVLYANTATVMAANEDASVAGTISASNVTEAGAVVNAYQIVQGDYTKEGKLKSYSAVPGVTIADLEHPTVAEIAKVASAVTGGSLKLTPISMVKGNDGKYTAPVKPGMYLVLVSGADKTVYNPAIAAVNIKDANSTAPTDGDVDLTSFFDDNTEDAYLKSSTTGFDKTIVDSTEANDYGDTLKNGDTATFKLSGMTIPSYSKHYADGTLVYKIEDTLDNTLTYVPGSIKVQVNGKDTPSTDNSGAHIYDVTEKDHAITVSFNDNWIRGLSNMPAEDRSVVITYKAKLSGAHVNAVPNTNSATLTYSRSAQDPSDVKTIKKDNYIYSFAIDSALAGHDKITHEILKGDETATGIDEATGAVQGKALAGAKFGLYSDADCTNKLAETTTDATGRMAYTGLDEGTYYIKEISAPAGYTMTDAVYKAVIAADLNADGSLAKYTVTITDPAKSSDQATTYTVNYKDGSGKTVAPAAVADANVTETTNSTLVKNTKLLNLPSTGAKAALILSVVGVAGMTAVVLTKRRKEED